MNLLQAELYKLTRRRLVMILCACALAFNLIGVYYTARERKTSIPLKDYKRVMEEYRVDPERIESTYKRIRESVMHQVELYLASLDSSESEEGTNVFSHEFNYSSNHKYFTDYDVLGTFFEKRDEAESYEKTVRTYIAQAETNKSRFSIIGNRQSYSYRYQDAIIERYESLLKEVDVQFDYIYGWDTFFSYKGDIVLSFLAVCLLAGVSVPDEQTSGMLPMLTVTRKGRRKTAAAKIGAVLLLCVFVTFLLRAESFLVIGLLRGYSDIRNPVQLIGDFVLCPLAWSCGELLIYSLLLLLLSVAFAALAVLAVSAVTKSYVISTFGGALVLVSQYVLYSLHVSGNAKHFNVFSASFPTVSFGRYRAVPLGNKIIPYIPAFAVLLAACCIAISAVTIVFFHKSRQNIRLSAAEQKLRLTLSRIFSDDTAETAKKTRARAFSHSILVWEFIKQRQILLVVCLLLIGSVYRSIEYPFNVPSVDKLYYSYTTELSGVLTDEKLRFIADERERTDEILNDYDEQYRIYRSGEITEDEYNVYLTSYRNAVAVNDVLPLLQSHAEYLVTLRDNTQIEGHFLYDTSWNAYITRGTDWIAYICVLLCACGVYLCEFRGQSSSRDFSRILRATKQGRNKTFRAKLASVTIVTLSAFLVSEICDAVHFFAVHGIRESELTAPLASIEAYGGTLGGISIGSYCLILCLTRLLSVLVMEGIFVSLSILLRQATPVYTTAVMITLFPHFMTEFGIPFFSYIDYCSFLSANALMMTSGVALPSVPFLFAAAFAAVAVILGAMLGKKAYLSYIK